MRVITCPTPAKSRYATLTAAENAATRAVFNLDTPLSPYVCRCGWWHLTKATAKPGGTATAEHAETGT